MSFPPSKKKPPADPKAKPDAAEPDADDKPISGGKMLSAIADAHLSGKFKKKKPAPESK